MQRVCVFCGSSPGRGTVYVEAAKRLARALVHRNVGVVYGGASVGVMGSLADATLDLGGQVIGVIPKHLMDREKSHKRLTELHIVDDMHERKALMGSLSDGFIALPGGLGTLEEFFEVLTWNQLGIHDKPCGLLNVGGYYDALIQLIDHSVAEQFVSGAHRSFMLIGNDPDTLLEAMRQKAGHSSSPGKTPM